MGTAAVVSQLDGPEPFIADLIAVGILAYAGYQAFTHQALNQPSISILTMAENNKQKVSVIEGLTTAAAGELEKLRHDPVTGGARNHHKGEIKGMLDRAKDKLAKYTGGGKEKLIEKIKEIEKAVEEIAGGN